MYDYSHTPAHGKVVVDNITYPFSVYPEFFTDFDDELDLTGNAHVVALTPRGTISFLIYNDGQVENKEHSAMYLSLPLNYRNSIMDVIENIKPR